MIVTPKLVAIHESGDRLATVTNGMLIMSKC